MCTSLVLSRCPLTSLLLLFTDLSLALISQLFVALLGSQFQVLIYLCIPCTLDCPSLLGHLPPHLTWGLEELWHLNPT